jgi:hypothetical protein
LFRNSTEVSKGGGTMTPSISRHSRGGVGSVFWLLEGLRAALAGASQAEVDAARVEGVEHPEALHDGDGGGGGVAQLDGGRANANRVWWRRRSADQRGG